MTRTQVYYTVTHRELEATTLLTPCCPTHYCRAFESKEEAEKYASEHDTFGVEEHTADWLTVASLLEDQEFDDECRSKHPEYYYIVTN